MAKFQHNSGNSSLNRTNSSGSPHASNSSQVGGLCDGGLSDDDDSDGARGIGGQGSNGNKIFRPSSSLKILS